MGPDDRQPVNAWHYAETDLWASLVAELFAQLAAPPGGERGVEQRRQSRLTTELINQRGLRERLHAARARRDDLQAALNRAGRDTLAAWDGLDDQQKQQLERLGGEQARTAYQDAVRTVASLGETGRASWRFLRSLRPLAVARLLALLAVAIGVAVVLAWVVPAVAGIREDFATMARLLADTARDHHTHRAPDTTRGPDQDQQVPAAEAGSAGRAGTPPAADEAGDTLPEIDRIIIYIDDLDRCPPARVVEMLEAIHLLLAVELFVVVVDVDPRWLLCAITAHYHDLENGVRRYRTPAHPVPASRRGRILGLVDAGAVVIGPPGSGREGVAWPRRARRAFSRWPGRRCAGGVPGGAGAVLR